MNDEHLEQVHEFMHLGSMMMWDGRPNKDNERRVNAGNGGHNAEVANKI